MNEKMFEKELLKLEIMLNEQQKKQLEVYRKFLLEKNKEFNLTSIVEKEEMYLKHFYDSLTLIKAINLNQKIDVCDFGSGAGFPGIILKVFFDKLNITLVESSKKKCVFLLEVIKILNLTNINVVCKRIEEHKQKYDLIVCRGVSKLSIISELVTKNLKLKGYFIAMKGKNKEELENHKKLELLGMEITNIAEFTLPIENSKRMLIKIRKQKESKKGFPREYKKIKADPLF